ncbi:MAG: Na(+)-translocating NADH-quinone reductase subunit A [Rikenellaceae bacterium]
MSKNIKLRKGLDIKLKGAAELVLNKLPMATRYAVSPLDFEGVTPKLLVKVGDVVKAGEPLFFDKSNERVLFTSPVSGVVCEIQRGAKRKILNVIVESSAEQSYKEFNQLDCKVAPKEQIVETLLSSGLWSMIIQRPYGVIANPSDTPRDIFISTFDSAPLAPDYDYVLSSERVNLQTGVDVLSRLTSGKIHLSLSENSAGVYSKLQGVEYYSFSGKHPVGNVGVQINNISPLNKGELIWSVNIQDLAIIGRLFNEGKVDMTKVVAIAGSEVARPCYLRLISGAPISSIVEGRIKEQPEGDSVRIISGNVLTGKRACQEGYISFYSNMVTVIPEGDKYEFMGWAMPRFKKFSVSKSYFSWLMPKREYRLDTNLNGGERAFVVTGLYEQYLPMDIYPMHLLKAIIAGDIDKMEALGIYEVIEEDFALCEFVDPSKTEMQELIRQGINLMIKEA